MASKEFQQFVEIDPAWASKLTEPTEITDYCCMQASKITHLSPLLYFTGKDKAGDCASFFCCKSLRVAEGNFTGFVSFSGSNIQKIGALTCRPNAFGICLSITNCEKLSEIPRSFNPMLIRADYELLEKLSTARQLTRAAKNLLKTNIIKI